MTGVQVIGVSRATPITWSPVTRDTDYSEEGRRTFMEAANKLEQFAERLITEPNAPLEQAALPLIMLAAISASI